MPLCGVVSLMTLAQPAAICRWLGWGNLVRLPEDEFVLGVPAWHRMPSLIAHGPLTDPPGIPVSW